MKDLSKKEKFNVCYLLLCAVLSIFIFIFNKKFVEYVPLFVSIVVFIYGGAFLLEFFICDRKITHETHLFDGVIQILLGVIILVFLKEKFEATCIIWGFWVIIREGKELDESIYELKENKLAIIDMIESAVLLYFAISIIINPTEHHAHTHIILTGIEFIFNFILYNVNLIVHKNKKEKE